MLKRAQKGIFVQIVWAHILSALLIGVYCIVAALYMIRVGGVRDSAVGVIYNMVSGFRGWLLGAWVIVAGFVGLWQGVRADAKKKRDK